MQIEFLKYTNERNALSKTLSSDKRVMEGRLLNACSIMNPVIQFEGDLPLFANYMSIPSFGRFYFIDNIRSDSSKIFTVSGTVDVLQSFAGYIRECTGIVCRNETSYKLTLEDERYISYANPIVTQIPFTVSFPEREFVLAVAGAQDGPTASYDPTEYVSLDNSTVQSISILPATGYQDFVLSEPLEPGVYVVWASPSSSGEPPGMLVAFGENGTYTDSVVFKPTGALQQRIINISSSVDTIRFYSASDMTSSQGLAGLYETFKIAPAPAMGPPAP